MSFRPVDVPDHLYFVTAAICGWEQLFAAPNYAQIALDSLEWLRNRKRMRLFVFVLMPDHLHFINKPEADFTISQVLQNFGSFTAHEILKLLRQDRRIRLLQFFQQCQNAKDKNHKIWQDIQAKNIFSRSFLRQKMEYIHNNPMSKKWHLVEDRADYRYSSACF